MIQKEITFHARLKNARLVDPGAPLPDSGASQPSRTKGPIGTEPPCASNPATNEIASSGQLDPQWEAIEQMLAAIDGSLERLASARRESLDEMQQAVVELAVSIASRLVHRSLDSGAFGVKELVDQMLGSFQLAEPVSIHLHPDDLQLLRQQIDQQSSPWKESESCRLIADEDVGRGNCRVESDEVGILSKIDLQLSEMRQHLLECLDDAQLERGETQTTNRHLRRFPDRRRSA